MVPLRLLPAQEHYLAHKTYRNVVVKSRQVGFSTGEVVDNLWRCIWLGNINYCIAAHDEELARYLLGQVKSFIESMPRALRPRLGVNNRDELEIASTPTGYPINSYIWLVTAKGQNPGRGRHINILHGTEVAFWPEGADVMAALEASVPQPPHGLITYESSPNGAGGHFYRLYTEAVDSQTDPDAFEVYKPFFYAWWWEPTYSVSPVPRNFRISEEEERVAALARERDNILLTREQLYWRALTRREFERKGQLFYQEFPEDDATCFLSSNRAVFPVQLYSHLGAHIREPRDYTEALLETRDLDEKTLLLKELSPHLQAWVQPERGAQYVMGVDAATGAGKDHSCAVVLRKDTAEHVATFRTNTMMADVFAAKIDRLGRWYNNAFMVVERNMGRAVLDWLGHRTHAHTAGLNYPNLYYQIDERTGHMEDEPGFLTTRLSKEDMVTEFQEALASGRFLTHSKNLLREIRTYVHEPKGERVIKQAAEGEHDDELMAAMMAFHLRNKAPLPIDQRPPPSRGIRW